MYIYTYTYVYIWTRKERQNDYVAREPFDSIWKWICMASDSAYNPIRYYIDDVALVTYSCYSRIILHSVCYSVVSLICGKQSEENG